MYILGTDETNLHPSQQGKFFIYGGLILPVENLPLLDAKISAIRADAGYREVDEFKFDTRTRPEQVSVAQATAAKRETVRACIDLGATFVACVVHHGILKNADARQQIGWAANHVIGRFNKYLSEVGSYGLCLVDRLPLERDYDYLIEKFTKGLDQANETYIRLERITLFGSTCINASHFASAVDIVLGSFRYCVSDPMNVEAAREMLGNVAGLMWGFHVGDVKYIAERGLILRPKTVRKPEYRQDYEDLLARLIALA